MMNDVPFDLQFAIAKHLDKPTLISLRSVCRSWSQAAAVFFFRTLRVQVGKKGDFKRHTAMCKELSFIAKYCNELHLSLPGKSALRDHHNFPRDLELLASMFGGCGGVQTLGLENAWWPSDYNSATSTIALATFHDWTQDVDIPSLFPAITSLRFSMMQGYQHSWFASLVSSWPNLHTLDMTMNRPGWRADYGYTFHAYPASLRLFKNDEGRHFEIPVMRCILNAPAGAVNLRHLDVEIRSTEILSSFIKLLLHIKDTIKHLRLGFSIKKRFFDKYAIQQHQIPGITSMVLNSRARNTSIWIYTFVDAINTINLEQLRLEFNLQGRPKMLPYRRLPSHPPPTSLEHFPRLQRISVSFKECRMSATKEKCMAAASTILPILAEAQECGVLEVEHHMIAAIKRDPSLKLGGRKA